MTIGIYKLVFEGTDKVYIGQSICIEKRFNNHLCELRKERYILYLLEVRSLLP